MAKTNQNENVIQTSEDELDPGMRALGMIETRGLVALVQATDAMVKAANVEFRGWRKVGSALFFEVYDPNNWHVAYADRTPKGRNRHLPAAELADAIANWWNYLIVIPPPGGGANLAANPWLLPVDPDRIVHASGM